MMHRQRAAVQFKIQFSRINAGFIQVCFQTAHEITNSLVTAAWYTVQIRDTARHLNFFKLGTAAAISLAVGEQTHRCHPFFADRIIAVRDLMQRFRTRTDVCAVHVCQHLCAIHTLPPKAGIRKYGCIAPRDLGGQKIIYAAALHNLRNGKGITEGVRQPEAVGGISEIFLCKLLSPYELTDHGFTAGEIAVALYPHTAVGFITSLFHSLLNTCKQLRIQSANDIAMISGGLYKTVLRVFLHQIQLVCIGAGALLVSLGQRPKPGGIHMAVTDQANPGRAASVFTGKLFFHQRPRSPDGLVECFCTAGFVIVIQLQMCFIQRVFHLCTAETALGQSLLQRKQRIQIKHKFHQLIIADTDVDGPNGIYKALFFGFQRHAAGNQMICVALKVKRKAFPGLCLCADTVAVMIAMRAVDKLCRIVTVNPAVDPERCLIKSHLRIRKQCLAFQLLRNHKVTLKPSVNTIAAPLAVSWQCRIKLPVRNSVQRLCCLVKSCRSHLRHRNENTLLHARCQLL